MLFSWRDRPTFVTGATGFLGGHLVRHLTTLGADVVCLIRDWVPQSELIRTKLVERVTIVRGDVRDQSLLERIIGEYDVATVFHLAAQTLVGVANNNPVSTLSTNIAGTWSLLEACRRSPSVLQVIVASSDKAYGVPDTLPYREEMPLKGVFPYDVSKACADRISSSYAKTFGLPVALTRCANLFGGGDLNWANLIPGTIRSVFRQRSPMIRSDGNSLRDYLFVEDGVCAYICLAEQMARNEGIRGQAFNFSMEKPVSVKEVVETILAMMGSTLKMHVADRTKNEIPHQFLDVDKARNVLGWRSAFDLSDGLRATIPWYQTYLSSMETSSGTPT